MFLGHTIVPSFPLLFSEGPSVWDKAIEISTAFQLVLQEFLHPAPERLWLIPLPAREKKKKPQQKYHLHSLNTALNSYLFASWNEEMLSHIVPCVGQNGHISIKKQHITKTHCYSLVPKTSNKVISGIVWDKNRMEKTFYDLCESQQTKLSQENVIFFKF